MKPEDWIEASDDARPEDHAPVLCHMDGDYYLGYHDSAATSPGWFFQNDTPMRPDYWLPLTPPPEYEQAPTLIVKHEDGSLAHLYKGDMIGSFYRTDRGHSCVRRVSWEVAPPKAPSKV